MVHFLSRRFRHRDSGAVAVFTAIMLSAVFVGLCALVIDLGMARDTRRQAQNAADASVLAAGNALYLTGLPAKITGSTGAIAVAKSYVDKNLGVTLSTNDWANCTDSAKLSYYPSTACISFDSQAAPSAIRVRIPDREVVTPFAGIWGVSHVHVSAAAKIQLSAGRAVCGLCVIGLGNHDPGNGPIRATNTNVMFNGTLSDGDINVTGGDIYLDGPRDPDGTYSPAPIANQPAVADPLATLSMPSLAGLTVKTNPCVGPPTGGPGIYSSLELKSSCTMAPGLYVVTGPSKITSDYSITALGVTIYFTCGTPATPRTCNLTDTEPGSLEFTGSGTLTITAPTSPALTAGLAIIADPNNIGTFKYRGKGTVANTGTIYARNGTLDYGGNGTGLATDSLIVVKDLTLSGSSSAFTLNYTQPNNAAVPFSVLNLSQ